MEKIVLTRSILNLMGPIRPCQVLAAAAGPAQGTPVGDYTHVEYIYIVIFLQNIYTHGEYKYVYGEYIYIGGEHIFADCFVVHTYGTA